MLLQVLFSSGCWENEFYQIDRYLWDKVLAHLTGSELEDIYQLGERMWEAGLATVACGRKDIGGFWYRAKMGQSRSLPYAGRRIFPPHPDQKINHEDVLLLVGRQERVEKVKRTWLRY